jgi:hypothetical protein
MNKNIYVFSLLVLCSCIRPEKNILISPSKHYRLRFDINESHRDAQKYKCIIIKLYNSSEKLLDTFQTAASDYSKWAIGWHVLNDTILLRSKDVGDYAYKVSNSRALEKIHLSADLKESADSIFNKKYK